MSWIPRHAANYVSRYRTMDNDRTPDQRRCGKTWKSPVVEFGESIHFRPVGKNNPLRAGDERLMRCFYVGHHEGSVAAIFLTPDCVKKRTRITRLMEHERWDRVFSATCVGIPWQLRQDQRNLVRPFVPEAKAEQGFALVMVMPIVPNIDRRMYVTKRDLVKYGYTDECQACTQLASGMHNAKVLHDGRCRNRIGELMAGDDDQRQFERITSRTSFEVENEIPCREAGEEMDSGEPSVQTRSVHEEDQPRPETQSVPRPVEEQPIPTMRVGGSSGSGTRSGVGLRASETKTDDREAKRVSFTESRGQKRQGEDVEEFGSERRKNNILMQMLRCLHTRHEELKTLSGMQRMQHPNK